MAEEASLTPPNGGVPYVMKGGEMTKNQRNLLYFIGFYRQEHGTPPSYKEMVQGVGLSDNKSLTGVIRALEARGLVERAPSRRARSIRLTIAGWREFATVRTPKDISPSTKNHSSPKLLRYVSDGVSLLTPSSNQQWEHPQSFILDGTSNDIVEDTT